MGGEGVRGGGRVPTSREERKGEGRDGGRRAIGLQLIFSCLQREGGGGMPGPSISGRRGAPLVAPADLVELTQRTDGSSFDLLVSDMTAVVVAAS